MPKSVEIASGDRVDVEARPNRIGVRGLALAVAGGALLAYLMDPDRGRARRALTADRIGATGRRTARQLGRLGRRTDATIRGWLARARHLGPSGRPDPDDVTLAHRVETEVFRDPEVPKGRMNVNVENGVVVVRGSVDDEAMIATIERRIQRIPGVVGVRNLLHRNGTPAPNWPRESTATR
jgi:hypothetical protein